jgi:arsenate reductase (thioredoxin)
MTEHKPNILVLCTGNSCRSQMAEGYLRHYGGDRFHVHSAGTEPAERVSRTAIKVMAEDSIDISGGKPKHVKEFLGRMAVRYLIIVCRGANESCPRIFPGMSEKLLWPFDDPAGFVGTEEETLKEFRRVRDEIKHKILTWLETEGTRA